MKMKQEQAENLLQELDFSKGLVTAVVRDWRTKEILMVAHQNREAVLKTLTTGLMHYWSRSRNKLWLKGESSGHFQRVKRVFLDCDGDALIYDVEQKTAACHMGYYSCFFRKLEKNRWKVFRKKKFEPEEVYAAI
jgi:phosphoribosyl-AMP cyclohydrolase